VDDKKSFAKILTILEKQYKRSAQTDSVLLENIVKLKEAIQILNDNNTKLWL
jgi:hypothetical protein